MNLGMFVLHVGACWQSPGAAADVAWLVLAALTVEAPNQLLLTSLDEKASWEVGTCCFGSEFAK